MGSITSYSKQIVVFFLALSLFIRPTFASSVGGWSMGNPIAQGASTIYEGSKNVIINGADYVKKGTAKITPTAANVAKVLSRGGAAYALSVAVEQLLGSVDWVLDPVNNQIVYTEETTTVSGQKLLWLQPQIYANESREDTYFNNKFLTASEACSALIRSDYGTFHHAELGSGTAACYYTNKQNQTLLRAYVNQVENKFYEQVEEEEKHLPLPVVASQVISNAESDTDKRAAAQVATSAAAADIVAEAETDNVKARPIAQQLEASASTKPADQAVADKAGEAQGTAKPNEANPQATDLALEFPAFCGWAPTVCEYAQTATQAIADVKAEYADKPQENTDTELEIPDPEEQSIDTDISFGGSCPATLTSQVNFMGLNQTIEFSFDPVCEIAEFIKPVVISVSAFSAVLIVAGIRTEDD